MKNLLILGASGMGREVYDMALRSNGYGSEFTIKGFLDPNINALDAFPKYPNVISSEEDYQIEENDIFILSFGDIKLRKKVYDNMEKKGASFLTLIDKQAIVSPTAKIGEGSIIFENVHLGSYSFIGKNTLIQAQSIIGHDVMIGNHCRIDCETMFVGGVKVGNEVTVHTSAVINHNVILEDNSIVGACSFVIRKVKSGQTVFGVPAKRLTF